MFTYAYNAAGRLARAQSVTSTLVYTYNHAGLRVAQSVQSAPESVDSFAWDWASGLPEMLVRSPSSHSPSSYLVGHETLGRFADGAWAYHLPDALGSVRQATDAAGALTAAREWTPYGVEVGSAQPGLGYTGEWWDGGVGLQYLRARWYDVRVGRFTQRDLWPGTPVDPLTLNLYVYALANPVNFSDPSGYQSESEEFYIRELYRRFIKDAATRLNVHNLTNLSNDAFATMIAAKILVEDATIYANQQPKGIGRQISTFPVTFLRPWLRDFLEQTVFGGEISWGPANIPLPLAIQNLEWWEQNYTELGLNFEDVSTYYYEAREYNWFMRWLIGNEEIQLEYELQTDAGTVNQMALAILRTSWRIKEYYQRRYVASGGCKPIPDLSVYMIAMGIRNYGYSDDFIFELSNWRYKGMPWDWVEAMDGTAAALGLHLTRGDQVTPYDYLPYTTEEKEKLDTLQH